MLPSNSAWDWILPQYCTTPGQQPAVYPSLHHLEEKKQQQKSLGTHSVLAKACVENSLPEPSCLWLVRRSWLIQRLLTASHYVFIFCQNQKITSIFKIAAHSQMLFYSCPFKASSCRIRFPVKIQLGSQFNFRVISGELKDPRGHLVL